MVPKKNDEVKVEPSFIPYLKEPEIVEDTIEAERQRVFALTKRAGKSLSGLMITVGVLISFWSLQYLLSPRLNVVGIPTLEVLFSPEFIAIILGFLGVVNLICGFILIANE